MNANSEEPSRFDLISIDAVSCFYVFWMIVIRAYTRLFLFFFLYLKESWRNIIIIRCSSIPNKWVIMMISVSHSSSCIPCKRYCVRGIRERGSEQELRMLHINYYKERPRQWKRIFPQVQKRASKCVILSARAEF